MSSRFTPVDVEKYVIRAFKIYKWSLMKDMGKNQFPLFLYDSSPSSPGNINIALVKTSFQNLVADIH